MIARSNLVPEDVLHYLRLKRLSQDTTLHLKEAGVHALFDKFVGTKLRAPRTGNEFIKFFVEQSTASVSEGLLRHFGRKLAGSSQNPFTIVR
jgi:hypothetical protein